MKNKNRLIICSIFTIFIFVSVIAIILVTRYPLNKNTEALPIKANQSIEYQDIAAQIDELYIYGTHLNIKGSITLDNTYDDIKLIALNRFNEEIEINTIFEENGNQIKFKLADKINAGEYLDGYKYDKYSFFLRTKTTNGKETIIKYYPLTNKTNYKKTTYYTITKNEINKKITFNDTSEQYPTLSMNVEQNKDNSVYDIAIDAGHGGIDPGACYYGKCETDYTLELAKMLKSELEKNGLKVILTRETNSGYFPTYNEGGRVVIPQDAKAKYLFSFHLNSAVENNYNSGWNGIEVYSPFNTDHTLATDIATYVTSYTGTNFSNKNPYKVSNGVYVRTFRQNEIDTFIKEMDEEGYPRYYVDTNTNYYYLIRETGGYMTGAYTDGRDGKLKNPYVLSNVGIESYIMEIGYITDQNDLNNINNKKNLYVEAIAKAIINNIYK